MLTWNVASPQDGKYLDYSTGHGSVSDQNGMNTAFRLLGLLERFTIGNREYYWLFLLAAAGIAFHFPRRSQLESASYMDPARLS